MFRTVLFAIVTLLFFYVIYRAFNLSFTHDESLSFNILYGDIERAWSANNHLLNTLLMGVFSFLFGNSELSLRMPNLIAFGFYIAGGYLILKNQRSIWIIMLVFCLLLVNPLLLEFFSLARGYGLSLGFLMISLYFLLRNTLEETNHENFKKDFSYSMLFAAMALFSSFSSINFYIANLVIFSIKYFFTFVKPAHISKKFDRKAITLFLFALIPLIVGLSCLIWLNKHNKLYFGEDSLNASLKSVLVQSMYLTVYPNWILSTIKYVVSLSTLSGVILLFLKQKTSYKFITVYTLLFFMILGLIIEHYVFGAKYPSGRTMLVFLPVYSIYILYFLNELRIINQKQIFKFVLPLLSLIVIYISVFNFVNNFSLKYTYTWNYDAHTKDVMYLINESRLQKNEKLSLNSNWLFKPAINYYLKSRQMEIIFVGAKTEACNTVFIYDLELQCDSLDFYVRNSFPAIGTVLYESYDHK